MTAVAKALAHPAFAEIDRHFATLIDRLAGGGQPDVALAAVLASHRAGAGGLFADLRAPDAGMLRRGEASADLSLPDLEPWLERLRASGVVGGPGDFKPLILDACGRLYLHRCWEHQQRLASATPAPGGAEGVTCPE